MSSPTPASVFILYGIGIDDVLGLKKKNPGFYLNVERNYGPRTLGAKVPFRICALGSFSFAAAGASSTRFPHSDGGFYDVFVSGVYPIGRRGNNGTALIIIKLVTRNTRYGQKSDGRDNGRVHDEKSRSINYN